MESTSGTPSGHAAGTTHQSYPIHPEAPGGFIIAQESMPNIVIHQLPPYGQGMPLCSTNHQCLKMMDLYIDATLLMEYTTKMHLADFCLAPTKYHPGKTFIKLLTHKTKMSVPNRKHSSLNTKNKEYFDIIKKCTN